MTASTNYATTVVDVKRGVDPLSCEKLISGLPKDTDASCTLRLASNLGGGIFSDVWASILVGTTCRTNYSNLRIVAWGQNNILPESSFANSIHGITALQLCSHVTAENDKGSLPDQISALINEKRFSALEDGAGKSRTLIEFDPQRSSVFGDDADARSLLFRDVILQFRKELELGYRNRNIEVTNRGEAGILTKFLGELHANSFKYARNVTENHQLLRNLRIIRLKAHLATKREELIGRAAAPNSIRTYLAEIARGRGAHGVMEAIVSDFGQGIVDHFLSSARGISYRDNERRRVLA